MPILAHSPVSSFPFRRRHASSPTGRHSSSSDSVNTPLGQSVLTDPSNHLPPSRLKPSSASHSNLTQLHRQAQTEQSPAHILRSLRHPSTHFEKLQAKMSSARLRSSTLNPPSTTTHRSASRSPRAHTELGTARALAPPQSPNPPRKPLEIRLPWETALTDDEPLARPFDHIPQPPCLDSHPQITVSPSLVSIGNSDNSSSHLTLTSEPSSNKLVSKSTPWTSNSPPPELELSFLYNSPSLLSGLPFCEDSPSSEPPPPVPSTDTAGPLGSVPLDRSSRPPEPTTAASSDRTHQSMACSLPRTQQPFHVGENLDRAPIVNQSIHGASASLTSRVRPTPSPRSNAPIHTLESQSPSSSPRQPHLPPRLRALPLLDSYPVTSNQLRPLSDSSGSTLSDPRSAAEDEVGSDDTDGVSCEGRSRADSTTQEQPILLTPQRSPHAAHQSHVIVEPPTQTSLHEWITFDSGTPPVPKAKAPHASSAQDPEPQRLTPSTNHTSYFPGSTTSTSRTPTSQSPADRARLLLSSPPSSSAALPSRLARSATASHRSHSASRLAQIVASQPLAESRSVSAFTRQSSSYPEPKLENAAIPAIIVSSTNVAPTAVEGPPRSTSQSALLSNPASFTQRHQSMYELWPSPNLPSYEDSLQNSGTTRHTVVPREEEGREKLPKYSCAIHLEGWMPRKMEFKSPGVQAKDRAWKRQYVIVHGTMIRIYRSDPHVHALARSDDPYSSHFVHRQSLCPLASTSRITSQANSSGPPPLHFHQGQYDSAPVTSLKEAALVKATQLPTHHNCLHRVYSLQNAESGLAADYVKKKYIIRVRAEGEQFLLQAKDDRGVIDLIEALQAATNVSLDLDIRPLPKFITLPRRRRRRRIVGASSGNTSGRPNRVAGRELGAAVVEGMIAEAEATDRHRRRQSSWADESGDRMADMLAEEQEAYMQARN